MVSGWQQRTGEGTDRAAAAAAAAGAAATTRLGVGRKLGSAGSRG